MTRPSGPGLFFSGWYAETSWTIIGQPRRWKSKRGAWGAPSGGTGGWGAVEIGARYSTADLDSRDIHGGQQHIWSADISWYPTQQLRFILEGEHASVSGGASPHQFDAVAFRGQLKF